MPFYDRRNSDIITKGYVRQMINMVIPHVIIMIINVFYGSSIKFNIYDSKTKKHIKNCVYFNIVADARFYINNDGTLFVNGDNIFGQLGMNSKEIDYKDLTKHNFFNGYDIALINNSSINGHHCFIYTWDNKLYGFGYNKKHQIAKPDENARKKQHIFLKPELLRCDFDSILVQIACGDRHTLFLTKNGNVYGTGANNSGQLIKITYATEEEYLASLCDNLYNHKIHRKILDNNDIKRIGCCKESSYVMDNNDVLFSFGDNEYGQLGIQNIYAETTYNKNRVHDGKKLKTFDCGELHIGILTDNNHVWMYGLNDEHQCGNMFGEKCHGHKIVLDNELITGIKCGLSHNIIKTHKNNYYGFGCNSSNQLLIPNNFNHDISISKPTLISKEYLSKLINSNNDIIDLIPIKQETFIIY